MEVVTLPSGSRHERVSRATVASGVSAEGELRSRRRLRAARHLETVQEAASIALGSVSSYLETDRGLPTFFKQLCETVAGLVGARRAAFWRLSPQGKLAVQPDVYGFPASSRIHDLSIELELTGDGIAERIVFRDELGLDQGTSAELDRFWLQNGLRPVRNSIAVSWRAGDRRIGMLAAYDSRRGFDSDDAWVLRIAAMATGLVWQYHEATDELDVTVDRLEEAMSARRRLLANVASGGDEARRRFATALHDDSLQLLTAAELQLERILSNRAAAAPVPQLEQLAETLKRIEASLRRLLLNVSPQAPSIPVGLNDAIRERLDTLRLHTGIEPDIDLRLPADLPEVVESVVFKNVAEALTNVEKHSHAVRVRVAGAAVDGGVGVKVSDDGTGFVVAECIYVPGHLGLLAMRERAQLAGGWCRIDSEPGAGARIEFWVPTSQ